jgi:hypothetical protein
MNGMQTTEAEELSAYTARTRAHDLAEIALDSWNRGEITDEWFLLMVEEAGRKALHALRGGWGWLDERRVA